MNMLSVCVFVYVYVVFTQCVCLWVCVRVCVFLYVCYVCMMCVFACVCMDIPTWPRDNTMKMSHNNNDLI